MNANKEGPIQKANKHAISGTELGKPSKLIFRKTWDFVPTGSMIRYRPPIYVLYVSSHFRPFTIVKFVLEKLIKT